MRSRFLCDIYVDKVLEGEVMTEEELKKSRSERDALDFLQSSSGQDYLSNCIMKILLFSRRRD